MCHSTIFQRRPIVNPLRKVESLCVRHASNLRGYIDTELEHRWLIFFAKNKEQLNQFFTSIVLAEIIDLKLSNELLHPSVKIRLIHNSLRSYLIRFCYPYESTLEKFR